MGNTVPEKVSIKHCRYTVMFPILSGFMGISVPPQEKAQRVYLLAKSADRAPVHRLGPVRAVQGAVLNGLAQMLRRDVFGGFQVRDGTRHFQVVGTSPAW